MPGYTSFNEMQRAKKMHGCDMSLPRGASGSPAGTATPRSSYPSNSGAYSARSSHHAFEHDKVRHQAEVLNSPPRDRAEPAKPTVYGHSHDELSAKGPPFHKSCREFGHEKVEHLTPILPDRTGSPGAHGCGHAEGGQCTSNDTFSNIKRKHKHEIDSCSPRRSARGSGPDSPSPARSDRSYKVTSQEQFRSDKAMHRHDLDGWQDRTMMMQPQPEDPHKSPRCTSAESFRFEKQRHRHAIDECCPHDISPSHDHADETGGHCISVDRFTRNKHAHRHGMDECHPRAATKEDAGDDNGPVKSYTHLSKMKRNHDYALDSSPDKSPRLSSVAAARDGPPKHDKSNIALSNQKRAHTKDMSGRRSTASMSPQHCISNEVYTDDKKKHKHLVDECRDGSDSPHRHAHGGGCGHGHGYGHDGESTTCVSVAKLDQYKRRHSHLIDECREEMLSARRERDHHHEASEGGVSPRCTSNHDFNSQKRAHRHLLDGCSPGRDHSHSHGRDHDCDHGVCTSYNAFSHDKRSNRIGMDDCRTPRRELFDMEPSVPEAAATPQTPED